MHRSKKETQKADFHTQESNPRLPSWKPRSGLAGRSGWGLGVTGEKDRLSLHIPEGDFTTLSHIHTLSRLDWRQQTVQGHVVFLPSLKLLSCVQLFVILWITACQASLSMGFSRKNTGVGCHTHGLSKPSKEERLKFRVWLRALVPTRPAIWLWASEPFPSPLPLCTSFSPYMGR